MANTFELTLDTTGPYIEIYGINYTVKGSQYEFTVISDSSLMLWQDVYYIDSIGQKITLVLKMEGKKLTGITDFSQACRGIATIYVTLRDDVGNISNTAMLHVDILDSVYLYCNVSHRTRLLLSTNSERRLLVKSNKNPHCRLQGRIKSG